MEEKRILSIEIIRFLAAFSILLHHVPTIQIGAFGVDIFFIISGFVMMFSTRVKFSNFLLKRLVRVIPLYWTATLLVYVITIVKPDILNSTTNDISHLLNSLFFIPFNKNGIGHAPLLEIGWTLNLEILFYLIFYVSLLISIKYRDLIATILICSTILLFNNYNFFIANIYSDILLIEFVLGIIIYNLLYEKKNHKNLLIISSILSVILIKNIYPHRFFYFGIPLAILCYLFIKYSSKLRYSKLLFDLGGMSYALYISHVFIIRIYDRLFPWFNSQFNIYKISATIISVIGSVIIGYLIYKYIDIPIYKKLKSFL